VAVKPAVVAVAARAEGDYEANRVRLIYEGSDGAATKALYTELAGYGPIGIVAINLFRAQKCAARATFISDWIATLPRAEQEHQNAHYAVLVFSRRHYALVQLAAVLGECAADLGIGYGWGCDLTAPRYPWVLYVDLPTGQVSFHALTKGDGPAYPGVWDGVVDASAERIIAFVNLILHPSTVHRPRPALVKGSRDQTRRIKRARPRRRVSRAKPRR
jgi:hypothetical protein